MEKYLLQNCACTIVIFKKKMMNIDEKSRPGPGVPYVFVKNKPIPIIPRTSAGSENRVMAFLGVFPWD